MTTPELLATVAAAAAGAPQAAARIVVGGGPDGRFPGMFARVDFAELESAPAAASVRVGDDDLAALMYTPAARPAGRGRHARTTTCIHVLAARTTLAG